MKCFFFCLLLVAVIPSVAQDGFPGASGARGMGMGLTGLTFQDIHSAFCNPAGLAGLQKKAALAFAENRFGLRELRQIAVAAGLPVRNGAFALRLQQFGFKGYNEQQIGLIYARRIHEDFQIGAQFIYFGHRIPTYGSRHLLTFQLGLQARLFSRLHIGAGIYNPLRLERSAAGELLPTQFDIGIGYTPSSGLLLTLEAEKNLEMPIRMKGGIEYKITPPLLLRVGGAADPGLFTFGVGLRLNKGLGIDLAGAWHQFLGWSPSIGLILQSE